MADNNAHTSNYEYELTCSKCGYSKTLRDIVSDASHTCPNCGGKFEVSVKSAPAPKYSKDNPYYTKIEEIDTKPKAITTNTNDNDVKLVLSVTTSNGNLLVVDEGDIRSLSIDEVGYFCIYKNEAKVYQPILKGIQRLLEVYDKTFHLHRVAVLGGGCCTIPIFIIKRFNNTVVVDSIEINNEINALCKRYFLDDIPLDKLNMLECDAIEYINETSNTYDFIFVDLYIGSKILEAIESQSFLQALQKHLNPKGITVFNRWFTTSEADESLEHKAWKIFKEVKICNNFNKEKYVIMSNAPLSREVILSYQRSRI